MKTGNIILGGGCFWCLEAVFQLVDGVLEVESGYMGGDTKNPTYEDICTGLTNHAEVVYVKFDKDVINLEKILEIFWQIHDPTTQNRQGNDIGTQYRSAIFYEDEKQKQVVLESLKNSQKLFSNPIVTEICKKEIFYKAEEYHQNYYKNNPNQGYCQFVIAPKVKKFKKENF